MISEETAETTRQELIRKLREQLQWLRDQAIRGLKALERDGMVYGSGIVQGAGNEVDRLVGELHAYNVMLKKPPYDKG